METNTPIYLLKVDNEIQGYIPDKKTAEMLLDTTSQNIATDFAEKAKHGKVTIDKSKETHKVKCVDKGWTFNTYTEYNVQIVEVFRIEKAARVSEFKIIDAELSSMPPKRPPTPITPPPSSPVNHRRSSINSKNTVSKNSNIPTPPPPPPPTPPTIEYLITPRLKLKTL